MATEIRTACFIGNYTEKCMTNPKICFAGNDKAWRIGVPVLSGTNRALSWLFSYISDFTRLHYATHINSNATKPHT